MRTLFYPPIPRLRAACTQLAGLALLVPMLAAPPAHAQGTHLHPAAPAAEPAAAAAPLLHPAPPAPPTMSELPTGQAWQDAHQAVGQFPRGHADIVAWEKQQGNAPAAAPASSSHQHGRSDSASGSAPKRMHQHHQGHQPMHGSKP